MNLVDVSAGRSAPRNRVSRVVSPVASEGLRALLAGIKRARTVTVLRHYMRPRQRLSVNYDAILEDIGQSQPTGRCVTAPDASTAALLEQLGTLIRQSPYRLTQVRGIGFRYADAVALAAGLAPDDPARLQAGLLYALHHAQETNGQVGIPAAELCEYADRLLTPPDRVGDGLFTAQLRRAISDVLESGEIVEAESAQGPICALPWLVEAEGRIAETVRAQLGWNGFDERQLHAEDVARAEEALGLTLSPSQRAALYAVWRAPASVITGGPGVGKTTLVRALLALWPDDARIVLCAPTGRAAKRLSETTRRDAATIHRLLEFSGETGGFTRTAKRPLDADVVIVDESSMIDVPLMDALVAAVPPGAQVVLVGDVDQLPPVGPGRPFADLIAAGAVPVVRLTEIHRQARGSRIVTTAHRVNAGQMIAAAVPPPGAASDFYLAPVSDADAAARIIEELVTKRIDAKFGIGPSQVQVLTPMKKGACGTDALNARLQAALNAEPEARLDRFGSSEWRTGDPMIHTRNHYGSGTFNGDIGRLVDVGPSRVRVEYDGRGVVDYRPRANGDHPGFGDLQLAYALTVHKAQGSEYPVVVLPVLREHFIMLKRNLLYTAITRARRLVVLVGQMDAIAIAIRTATDRDRYSTLATRLRSAPPPQQTGAKTSCLATT